MSLFRRRLPEGETRDTPLPAWQAQQAMMPWSYSTFAGVRVGPVEAMEHAAVWACVRLLAGTISTLPVDQIRYRAGNRVKQPPSPVVVAPSGQVRRSRWVYQVVESLLRNGNAYAQVLAVDSQMRPTQLETINAANVSWNPIDGLLVPHVNGKPMPLYPRGEMWHVAAYVEAGNPVGLSPVQYARQSIGAGLAAEKFGSEFFGGGGHPTQHVTIEGPDIGDEGTARFKQHYQEMTRNRSPLVTADSIKIAQLQVDPSDSQFVDLMRFTCEQVARWFYVPPEMIFSAVSGQSVTYSNASDRDLSFLKYSLGFWLGIVEEAWSECLPDRDVVRFNVDGLLRSDIKTRYETYDIALRNGVTTKAEVRNLEDSPPVPDFDPTSATYTEKINAVGALVRAGFQPDAALKALKLPAIKHTGTIPVTVQPLEGGA